MESGKVGRRELGCESYAMQRLVTQTDVHHLGARAGASSSEVPWLAVTKAGVVKRR